ncbi:hypothetical protein PVAND_003753 [Polypedilum vanderplanki]|uniref:Uncharacterized protein n=1 Tax=Polypedilum vanderplanki TaxID=319348 RepID=A0A9J6BW39_POLVA|nr:hypothetical protein PVAND_003753 [Polypedilum vanderplanki]
MDKLLLSLSLAILLTSLTVNSAPMSTSKIISAIEQQQRQKKFGQLSKSTEGDDDDDDYVKIENVDVQKGNKNANIMKEYINDLHTMDDENDSNGQFMGRYNIIDEMRRNRQNKMIGYFNYNPYFAAASAVPYSSPVYYPPEFFDDFAAYYGYNDEDEITSRQNPGRRRPGGNFKNSPIYYIRLPPTPYMFVPGLGYISQPPSYAPMAPPPPPPAISSFYNLPLDFISNGKPTNIYQYQSPAFAPQPQFIPQAPSYPMYQRPQRPYHESKVTNLKGAFLFNGRPEEIYVLPPTSSIYPDPRFISPFY